MLRRVTQTTLQHGIIEHNYSYLLGTFGPYEVHFQETSIFEEEKKKEKLTRTGRKKIFRNRFTFPGNRYVTVFEYLLS